MKREKETREWEVDSLEVRGTGSDRVVTGQAVPINRLSQDLGGFREVIRPGAATEAVRENDILMLWQHDTAQPISKTTAKNHALVIEERKTGVWFSQPAAAFTDFQLSKIDDGVVDKMSFGFFVENREDEKWHEDQTPVLREIFKMNLVEISPVTFAAYQSTKVALRHAAEHGVVVGGARATDPKAIAAEHERDRERIRLAALGLGQTPPAPPRRDSGDAARREHEQDRKRLEDIATRLPEAPPSTRRQKRDRPAEWEWRNLLFNAKSRQELRALAYHESAHAVASVCAGIRLDSVELYAERTGYGGWRMVGGKCKWGDVGSGDRRVTALIYMAGPAGETLVNIDRQRTEGSDEIHARKLSTQDTILRDLSDAKSLLKRHWSAVHALAQQLITDQSVDGSEAEALIVQHLDSNTRARLKSVAA